MTLVLPSGVRMSEMISEETGRRIEPVECQRALAAAMDIGVGTEFDADTATGTSFVEWLGLPRDSGMVAWRRLLASNTREDPWYDSLAPGTVQVLSALEARGYRMGVLSNGDGTLIEELTQFGLLRYFSVTIDSAVVGCEKPAPEIFAEACAAARIEAEDAHMIGDGVAKDCDGALRAGFGAVVLVDLFDVHAGSPHRRINELEQLLELYP